MSTEARVVALAKKHLFDDQREPDLDLHFNESDVSSMAVLAFAKALGNEFNHQISAEDFPKFECLRNLITHLDS